MSSSTVDLTGFRNWITQRLGLRFDQHHTEFLEQVVRERATARECGGVDAYVERLAASAWPDEGPRLAARLTIGETYFFRNPEHFQVLTQRLPAIGQSRRTRTGRSRILCAGCASGEEAYSIAMALQESSPVVAAQTEILAIDINSESLSRARRGRYSSWSLRETPPPLRDKYFRFREGRYELDEALRSRVSFAERNLADLNADLWQVGAFDVVFCRNVLMYLDPALARGLAFQFARALSPGGLLFLGHAETLRELSTDFRLKRWQGAFYYEVASERSPSTACPTHRAGFATDTDETTPAPLGFAAPDAPGWYETISRAAARIATLAESAETSGGELAVDQPADRFSRALDLHSQERFQDALTELRHPTHVPEPADERHRLLQAMLLLNLGHRGEAEELCRPWLDEPAPSAGCLFIAALCRESCGDLEAAETYHARAAERDPAFAMAHFHRGLLCRRLGRVLQSRTAFRQALSWLASEFPERLTLFGGGFNRETLIAACRAELERLPSRL